MKLEGGHAVEVWQKVSFPFVSKVVFNISDVKSRLGYSCRRKMRKRDRPIVSVFCNPQGFLELERQTNPPALNRVRIYVIANEKAARASSIR